MLLPIEDVHWADGPTLLLLRHLARSAGNARMLLLATFRDTGGDIPEQLSEALVELRRVEGVERLALSAWGTRRSPNSSAGPAEEISIPPPRSLRTRSASSPTATRFS